MSIVYLKILMLNDHIEWVITYNHFKQIPQSIALNRIITICVTYYSDIILYSIVGFAGTVCHRVNNGWMENPISYRWFRLKEILLYFFDFHDFGQWFFFLFLSNNICVLQFIRYFCHAINYYVFGMWNVRE